MYDRMMYLEVLYIVHTPTTRLDDHDGQARKEKNKQIKCMSPVRHQWEKSLPIIFPIFSLTPLESSSLQLNKSKLWKLCLPRHLSFLETDKKPTKWKVSYKFKHLIIFRQPFSFRYSNK